MATTMQNARELLAKMQAEEAAAKETLEALAKSNDEKRKALLEQLRESDLTDVREKCRLHGFTATELRGYLKTKGGGKKPAATKSDAKRTATKRKYTRKSA